MTKCNVIPQVTNSTSSVDSKLFKSINSSLGTSYKGVELRNKTKELYKKYDSKDFKSIFGDWRLYQRLKFETATTKDLAMFHSLYNSNIELLEKSLNKDLLNDLYEPEFISNVNNVEAYETFDKAYLDGKQIIHFKSQSELNSFISQFGDKKSVLNNLLTTKNIYLLAENKYITNTTDNRVAQKGNSSVVSNGSIFSLSESNKLFTEQSVNTVDRNVSFLGDIYNTSDIIFISKLTSVILLNDIDEFKQLTDKKATKGISTSIQQKNIDKFMQSKISIFRDRLISNLDEAINKENNPFIKESLVKEKSQIQETYNDLLKYLFLANPNDNKRPITYHALLSHLRSNFGIGINSESGILNIQEEDENGDIFEYELSQAHFGGKAAMKIDQKKNVMQEVKFTLAKSLAKTYLNSSITIKTSANKFGVQEPLEIDDVWSIFISLSSSNASREEMLISLQSISNNQYNGLLDDFIHELRTNESIWNGFYASVNLPLIINKTLTLTQETNGTLSLKTVDNNYNARASNIAYEQLLSNIQIHIENNENYMLSVYEASGINGHSKDATLESIKTKVLNGLNTGEANSTYQKYVEFISARISAMNLSAFMSFEDISQSIYIDNKLDGNVNSINFSKLSETTKHNILEEYKKVVISLIEVTNGIKLIQELRKNKTEEQLKSFKFRDRFNERGSVRELAVYNKHKYLTQIDPSYMNVEGEMEHSGQKPFYVSDFFKAIQSSDSKLNEEVIQKHLSDFLNSPAYRYNQFLYNLDGDGTGIFNVIPNAYNENGTPKLDTNNLINIKFIKDFESGQFGGLKNTNNNKGIPYDELVEDTFNLTAIAKAMQGIWITPSSDATRSYEIKMPKYGSKHFITDTNGNFVSLRKVAKELGLIDSKGNIKRRQLSDINEDSKFFFDRLMPSKNTFSERAIKSLKELREIYEDNNAINKAKRRLVKNLINNINNAFDLETIGLDSHKQSSEYALFSSIYNATKINPTLKPTYHQILGKVSINKVYEDVNNELSDDIYLKALQDIVEYFIDIPSDGDVIQHLRNPNFGLLKEDENTIIHLFNVVDNLITFDLDMVSEARVIKDSAKKYLDNPSLLLENDEKLIASDINDKGLYIKYLESKQYKAIKRTVLSEALAMATVSSNMFRYGFRLIEGTTEEGKPTYKKKASNLTLKDGFQEECDKGLHHDVRDYLGRTDSTFDKEGKETEGKAIVISKGEPTGRVFNFNRLTFSNGKRIFTMLDYIKPYLGGKATKNDLIILVARTEKQTHPFIVNGLKEVDSLTYSKMSKEDKLTHFSTSELNNDIREAKVAFDAIYNDFIEDYLENKQAAYIQKAKPIELELKSMKATVPIYVAGTSDITRENEREQGYLISTFKTNKDLGNTEKVTKDDFKAQADPNSKFKDIEYRKSILEVIINNIIQTANIGEDMLYGRTYEYKNTQEVNKRVSEIIRSGTTVNDNRYYKSATCQDIETASNMLDKMIQHSGLDSNYIMKNFAQPIEVGNGFSFITVKEFEVRARATNHWNRLEPYVKSLTDPNTPIDPKAVKAIVEQLKYFMYSRQAETSGTMKGNVTSYQEKNSTMVLFPKLWANTEYEAIINTMEETGIDQFNFKSGSKLSVPLLRIHDVTAKYTTEAEQYAAVHNLRIKNDGVKNTLDFSSYGANFDINNYIVSFKRSNLRIQQEQVSHIMETDGKLATQANKKIDVNLNADGTFTVNGQPYKGKTGSYEEGKRGVFENRHSALHYNLKEDRDKLIYTWGAIKNGVIQKDMQGNILVDISKIRDSIYKYYEGTTDISLMKAFSKIEGKVSNIMSMNHPLIKNTIESVLQAAITRNVNIELPQIHGTIIPDTFVRPTFSQFKKGDIITQSNLDEYNKNGHISYTEEFLKSWLGKPISEWELRGEDYDVNGNIIPAQIILNIWDSRFDQYAYYETIISNGVEQKVRKIDINQIPPESRTVYFTRIPHEGMQSAGVAEVVGFMNTGASQIIVPKHLSKRTGWDYDIDSLYIYYRHLYEGKDSNGKTKLLPVSYENDVYTKTNEVYNTEERKRLHVVKTYFANEYNELIESQKLLISKARQDYKKALDTHHDSAFNTVYDLLDDILNDPDNDKYKSVINYIRTQLGDFTGSVESVIKDFEHFGYKDYEKLYIEMFDELNNILDETLETESTKDKIDKYLETHSITSSSTRNMLTALANAEVDINNRESKEKLLEQIESIKTSYEAKLKALIESEEVSNVYKSMPPLQQMTRETRDNMIIDSLIAVTMSSNSTPFREKVNEFNTLNEASKAINAKLGLDSKSLNFTDMFDRLNITSANKNIARLKGVAIQNQNTYSLLGVVGASVSNKFLVPTVITQDEFLTDNLAEQEMLLEHKFGIGNVEKKTDKNGKVKYIVYNTHLGNNRHGDWTNVHGRLITEQSSEIAANVLDAVKFPMAMNNGLITQGVLDLFVNTPISHVTDIYAKDKSPNSFVYVQLLIAQPVVTKLINHINTNSRNGKSADKNNAYRTVSNDLKINIIKYLDSIDIIRGTLRTEETASSILDVIIEKYSDITNADKSKAIADKISEWRNAARNGSLVYMNDTSGVNGTEVYAELINFLTKSNISEIVEEYINNSSKIQSESRPAAFAAFEQSNLKSLIEQLNISNQVNSNVYSRVATKKSSKLVVSDEKSLMSIEELKDVFEEGIDKGYSNFDYEPTTVEEIIDYVNFIDTQLSLFKLYQQYDKTANLVSKASLVLRTDKLGTSPNAFVTLKLNDDMAALHIDYSEFDENLKLAGMASTERQKIKFEYDSALSIADKIQVLTKHINRYNESFDKGEVLVKSSNSAGDTIEHKKVEFEIPKSGLRVINEDTDKSLLESVFPNFVRGTLEEDYKFEDSSLPLFESQYVNNYYFSIKALSGVLLSSNTEMVSLLKGVVSELGIAPNRYNTSGKNIYQRVLDSIIVDHIYNEVPFFNGGTTDQELRAAEIVRVIGNVMPVSEVIKDDDNDILNSRIVLDIQGLKLEDYRTLSVANQVFLLKSYIDKFQSRYSINEIEDIKSVLDLFKPKLDLDSRQKNGYHKIEMSNTTQSIAKLQQIFRSMYFNDNPFIRQTARDLIRYSFYFQGLNWGMNVSKILDPSLMYEESEEYKQISTNTLKAKTRGSKDKDIFIEEDSSDRHRLYKVNEALTKLENQTLVTLDKTTLAEEIKRHADRIKSQVYDDNTISPVVYIKLDGKGWNTIGDKPIIYGDASFINNSWEGRNKYFKTTIKGFATNHKITFEKYEPANSTKVYYYPINKSLPYENTQTDRNTVVKKYTQFIESADYYKTLIDIFDAKYNKKETVDRNIEYMYPIDSVKVLNGDAQPARPLDYKYITNITKSNKTLSETAKEIIEASTKVIYLGNDKFYKNAFKSDKTYYSDLDNLDGSFFNSLDLQDTDVITIVGDSLSDSKYTQKQIDNAVLPFVRNIMYYYEFNSFKTIFKQGVGESVFKASFTSNKPNEYIEVGSRDVVRDIEYFDIDSNVMSGTHSSIQSFRETALDVFTYTRGIHDELVHKLDTKPDTFAFKHTEIIKYISGLNTDNYLDDIENMENTILRTLEHNVEILDKIYDYIENDTIKFRDTTGTVTMKTTVLALDIQKYMRSNNTNHKVLIAEKLSTYNKLMTIAQNIMSIMAISEPDTTTEAFKALDKDTQASILEFKKRLEVINLKIQNFKTDRPSSKIQNPNRSRAAVFESINKKLKDKTQEYMVTNVNNYTRNRKFGNLTDYGKLLKVIEKNQLSEVDFDALFKMNANEMAKLYSSLMKYNDDISRGQMYGDSIRSTGVALIDNMLFMINEIRIQTNEELDSKLFKLKQITNSYDKIKDKTFNYDKSKVRSSYLRDKFIDIETGQFISKYNWHKFEKDFKIKQRLASEYREYSNIFNANYDNYDNFTVYIQKIDKKPVYGEVTTKSKVSDKIVEILSDINNRITLANDDTKSYKSIHEATLDNLKESLQGHILKTIGDYNYYKLGVVNKTIIIGTNEDGTPKTRLETTDIIVRIKSDFRTEINLDEATSEDITIKRDKEVTLKDVSLYSNNSIAASKSKVEGNPNAIAYKELMISLETIDGVPTFNSEYSKLLNEYLSKGLYANKEQLEDFQKRNHIIVEDSALDTKKVGDGIFTRESDAMHESYKKNALSVNNGKPTINFYKIVPVGNSYINERYAKLETTDIEYLQAIENYIKEIIDDVFPNVILPENFVPFIFLNSSLNIKDSVLKLIGWNNIQKESKYYDYKGTPKHKFQSGYLIAPNINSMIKISSKDYTEAELEYQERVVIEANEQLTKLKNKKLVTNDIPEFKTFMDILEYNDFVSAEFIKENSKNLNYDIPSVLHELTDELYNIKSYSEFSKVYELLLETLKDLEARSTDKEGKNSKNKLRSIFTDETVSVNNKGENTKVYRAYKESADRLFKVSRTNNLFDQIVGSAIKLTSMNTMWFNFHTGVKNVTKGVSDLFIEYMGGEYANRKEFGWAMNTYRQNIPTIVATLFTKDVTVVPNLITGILHRFGYIYNDHTDNNLSKQTKDSFNKFVNATEALAFLPTMTGEHFLQFTTLLALMKSHRVVGNFIMSKAEFLDTERYNIYARELPEEFKKELDAYIEEQKSNKNKDNYNNYQYTEHSKRWMTLNGHRLSLELTKKLDKVVEDSKAEAVIRFEGVVNPTTKKREGGFKTVLEHYEFVEEVKGEGGKIVVDEKITKILETQFASRVQALNNSIHGVYNTIDRTKLQDTMFGEMFLQFRKWIMPTWYRWMGVKFSLNPLTSGKKQPFSEQLGHYRSGAFIDTFNFLKQPFIREYLDNKKAHIKYPALKAMFGMFKAYADYFRKVSFYYNQLTPHEQANIKRTAVLFGEIIAITGLLIAAGFMFGDDDEEDSFFKPKNSTILLLSGVQTEYMEMLPIYGWSVFYRRTKENVVPTERYLNSLATLTYDLIAYPIRNEEQRTIQRGQYAGENRLKIDLFKAAPIARQIHKQLYLGGTIQYYQMKNGSLNLQKVFFDEQLNNSK